MTINERIKQLRIENGLTLKEVAERIGVSEGTVQRYESSIIKEIPYKSIVSMAEIFGVSPGYIMGWEYRPDDLKSLATITEKDMTLIRAYHNATQSRQEAVRALLGLEDG